MELLLDKVIDPSAKDGDYGRTPLHWAVYSRHVEVVKLLLKKGVDLSIKDNNGDTPLHQAARLGYVKVV